MKKFLFEKPFLLESGNVLQSVEVAYNTLGHLRPDGSNVVWICHALTANSNVEDWWGGLLGSDALFDPKECFIVCANVLGSCYGTTGPLSINPLTGSPYYHSFPAITIRDIVKTHQLLAKHLGIQKIQLLIGGSLGGQQALEWAIDEPHRIDQLALIATNARHSPWGIAFNEAQRMAIEADQTWKHYKNDAGKLGLRAARALALLSYRHYQAYLDSQLESNNEIVDHFQASSYQNYQGEKLVQRFNAFSYWTLSKAMDSHNVGRGRASIEHALQNISCNTIVIGISSDILFPISEQYFISKNIPNAHLEIIQSPFGHDGFLIESEKIAERLQYFLQASTNYKTNLQ